MCSCEAGVTFVFVLIFGGNAGPTYPHTVQSRPLLGFVWSLTNNFCEALVYINNFIFKMDYRIYRPMII